VSSATIRDARSRKPYSRTPVSISVARSSPPRARSNAVRCSAAKLSGAIRRAAPVAGISTRTTCPALRPGVSSNRKPSRRLSCRLRSVSRPRPSASRSRSPLSRKASPRPGSAPEVRVCSSRHSASCRGETGFLVRSPAPLGRVSSRRVEGAGSAVVTESILEHTLGTQTRGACQGACQAWRNGVRKTR